jgi:hypothetical protein
MAVSWVAYFTTLQLIGPAVAYTVFSGFPAAGLGVEAA